METILSDYLVTCTTENCDNSGIEIAVKGSSENPTVICGVCFKEIQTIIPAE
jgi:hypothetical protein